MTERQIKMEIIERIEDISKILAKGKDIELRKDRSGIKVIAVDKKVM